MGLRRAVVCLIALAGILVPGTASAAISGTVYMDYNSNGAKDTGQFVVGSSVKATDAPVAGVDVSAYNATGTKVSTTTTAADGTYRLCSTGCSGTVRVEFGTPATKEPSFAGSQNGTSVRFVTDGSGDVDYAVTSASTYCQDNPDLMTCLQQATGMVGNPSFAARPGAFRIPAVFYGANVFLNAGRVTDAWPANTASDSAIVAPFSSIGSTFGVGVDRSGNAYYGTYVKRHSPYGPAGAVNAVYRVNIATGSTSTFVTLGGASLPAHVQAAPAGWPDYAADGYRADANANDVYHLVGRAGLGDVDVTPDGGTLLAVEMTQGAPKLWRVPILGSGANATAGTPVATAIPTPATFGGVQCLGNWHPMGIGVRGSRILVGGVCGGTETQWMANTADTSLNSRTNAAAFILEFDAAASGFQTIAAFSLGYPKGTNNDAVDTAVVWTNSATGLWHNWFDGDGGSTPVGGRAPRSQPMLSNIEIMDNGDLTLSFRDRQNDQTKSGSISYESTFGSPVSASNLISDAEVLRLCASGPGGYVRESNGACGAQTGASYVTQMSSATGSPSPASLRPDSPLYYMTYYGPDYGAASDGHPYTSEGGAASMPGSPYLWTTQFDPDEYTSQGLRAYGPCAARSGSGNCGPAGALDGAALATVQLGWGTFGWPGQGGSQFGKGNALGDLEIVCDAAPVQIGNRIWIDTNKDGIQDPGEPAVAGVTVHLYDATGALVGTAITDASGTYYFSSNVSKPAAGDGSSAGGGLVAGATFKVKLDNPADYAAGGPLSGYTLTTANVATQGTAVNSKATTVGGYPTIDIPARTAGQNNHTFDVGFYPPADSRTTTDLVAIGDYVWIDTNRNGIQDAGEKPLQGVRVTLLTPDGKRAKDAAGKVVPVKRTDAKGYYVFDGLKPGRYKVQFLLPSGYRFTIPHSGSTKKDSNPRATSDNPLRGITPVFSVYAAVKGNTIRNHNKKLNASFIDPTIDAGVVRYTPAPTPSPVTG